MNLATADRIAGQIVDLLQLFCHRIEIAGSVRRRRPDVGDIEVVAIPKPYDVGLFESGLAAVVNRWPKVKGELGPQCRYTQRLVPFTGMLKDTRLVINHRTGEPGAWTVQLDLFMPTPEAWGLIFAIRTGSAAFSHCMLAKTWSRMGYKSEGGVLVHRQTGEVRTFAEETDLFSFLGLPWVPPEKREIPQ